MPIPPYQQHSLSTGPLNEGSGRPISEYPRGPMGWKGWAAIAMFAAFFLLVITKCVSELNS